MIMIKSMTATNTAYNTNSLPVATFPSAQSLMSSWSQDIHASFSWLVNRRTLSVRLSVWLYN